MMDTLFTTPHGVVPLEVRCAMLAETGWRCAYLTCWSDAAWEDASRFARVAAEHGLVWSGAYVMLDPSRDARHPPNARVLDLLDADACPETLEVALRASDWSLSAGDADGDAAALAWMARLARRADERGVRLALYPHAGFWLERHEHAVRLLQEAASPTWGLCFAAYHWYALGGCDLEEPRRWADRVVSANVCGVRREGSVVRVAPLDAGEMDVGAVVGALRAGGFGGRLGVQGYGLHGDPVAHLERSRSTLAALEARAERWPAWSRRQPA